MYLRSVGVVFSRRVNPNKIHRQPIKFLKDSCHQVHHQLGLKWAKSTKRKGAFEFSNFSGQELGRGQRSSWLMGETTAFTSLYLLEASSSSQEDPSIVGALVCPSTNSEADRAVSIVALSRHCAHMLV